MRYYLSLLSEFAKTALRVEAAYRINLVFNAINCVLNLFAGVVVLLVIFTNVESVGGWSFLQSIALFGVFTFIKGFVSAVLTANLTRIPEYVHRGTFDHLLIRPVSSQIYVSLRYFGFFHLPETCLGLGLTFYAMWQLGSLNASNIALLALLLTCGMIILYAIWLTLAATAFWLVKVDNVFVLSNAVLELARFPSSAFPVQMRLFFTYVVPIAFVTTVPAEAAIGSVTALGAVGAVTATIVAFVICCVVWRIAVARYASASS